MSDLKRIEPGARYSEAVIHGGKVYTAGIVADSTIGKPVLEQTRDVLKQIDGILAQAGSDKTKIIKANIWLSSMENYADMNKAWDEWVVNGKAPARATVESKLASPDYAVEIMIEAAL